MPRPSSDSGMFIASDLAVLELTINSNLHELPGLQVSPLTHLCLSLHALTPFSPSEVNLFCSVQRRHAPSSGHQHAYGWSTKLKDPELMVLGVFVALIESEGLEPGESVVHAGEDTNRSRFAAE